MAVKPAMNCLQWSQTSVSHSPSSSQTLASAISSPSSKRSRNDGVFICRFVRGIDRSAAFVTAASKLYRTRAGDHPRRRAQCIRRACSASLDAFSDEEFSKKIHELALRFQNSDDDAQLETLVESDEIDDEKSVEIGTVRLPEIQQEPSDTLEYSLISDWPGREEIMMTSIERKANSVDLPLSLRIIKRKKQWQQGFMEAGESAYCSVKKAFSSMVFIIRELHSYTLQMRELLFYEDLQGILVRVQKEMHASFVWLFQQVFSHTPTLMVYVMILLANFTVHSMSTTAIAAVTPPEHQVVATESVSAVDDYSEKVAKSFPLSSSGGKTSSIGGSYGGGGNVRPAPSGTDGGDGMFRGLGNHHRSIVHDGVSHQVSTFTTGKEEMTAGQERRGEDEVGFWNSMVEEASRMEGQRRDEALDHDTVQRFVSPVTARVEADEYADYVKTELLYQTGLVQEPNNGLLLANYAQFLYLVAHDYDRAEEYFKKATGVEPKDAEAYNKYANFLWQARNDLWAAEETFLEAISADPTNSFYAANYAHFLWNTGGEDTCFPLSPPE